MLGEEVLDAVGEGAGGSAVHEEEVLDDREDGAGGNP